jgi:two-component system response regulator (stage 0 sporulation protein F)
MEMQREQQAQNEGMPRSVGILVVDDDDMQREVLTTIFVDEGYQVWQAADGIAALEFLAVSELPLVVLLDWRMPRADGLQLLATLSMDAPLAARHAYLLLTAQYDMLGNRLDQFAGRLRLSAMRKPFELDELLARVTILATQLATATSPPQEDGSGMRVG